MCKKMSYDWLYPAGTNIYQQVTGVKNEDGGEMDIISKKSPTENKKKDTSLEIMDKQIMKISWDDKNKNVSDH